MPGAGYLAERLVQAIVCILGISAIVFGVTHLIGDPVHLLLPPEASASDREAFRPLDLGIELMRALHGMYPGTFTLKAKGNVLLRHEATIEAILDGAGREEIRELLLFGRQIPLIHQSSIVDGESIIYQTSSGLGIIICTGSGSYHISRNLFVRVASGEIASSPLVTLSIG